MHSLKWKPYNKFISVSEHGDVKSHGRLIKGEITRNGYRRIHVSDKGVNYKFLVHRLVAQTFIGNPNNLPCVNHKDGDKQNNNVANLEWCTASENLKHAYKTKLRSANGELNNRHKLTSDEVLEIRSLYVKGKHSCNNSYGLAKKYGVSSKTILNIVHGRSWK